MISIIEHYDPIGSGREDRKKSLAKKEIRMETRLILSPGQNGTKKLVKQYGEKLVCVRYRL